MVAAAQSIAIATCSNVLVVSNACTSAPISTAAVVRHCPVGIRRHTAAAAVSPAHDTAWVCCPPQFTGDLQQQGGLWRLVACNVMKLLLLHGSLHGPCRHAGSCTQVPQCACILHAACTLFTATHTTTANHRWGPLYLVQLTISRSADEQLHECTLTRLWSQAQIPSQTIPNTLFHCCQRVKSHLHQGTASHPAHRLPQASSCEQAS